MIQRPEEPVCVQNVHDADAVAVEQFQRVDRHVRAVVQDRIDMSELQTSPTMNGDMDDDDNGDDDDDDDDDGVAGYDDDDDDDDDDDEANEACS